MTSNVPPGAPRQSPPPNYNPNYQQNPNILSDNFQNLNLNRPPSMANSAPRPSPFSQPSPFPSSVPSPQFSRPGAPPIGAVPRPSVPPSGSPSTFSSNVAPGRPTGPPFSQPPPFGSRPPPGSFQSYTSGGMVAGPVSGALPVGARPSPAASSSSPPQNVPPSSSFGGLVSNGSPAPAFQSAPHFPPSVSAPQQQPMGPPPTMGVARSPPQSMRPLMGSSGFSGQPVAPFSAPPQGTPFYAPPQGTPFSAPPQGAPFYAPPQGTPFSAPPQGTPFSAQQGMTPPPIGSPFAPQMQPQSVAQPPPIPGSAQPPRMFGMPPLLPNQMTAISPVIGHTGSPLSGASKIDPNQIPRPIPGSSVILHDTRAGNQANPPPPATSDYIVTDTGNCSPRYMRCTINQIPCTVDLLSTSGMQLALLVQPLALPHSSEEAVQVVDFGESGPVRCSRCKGYINPFMKFIDQGRRFICNLCGFTDETPRDYLCNLGPDGRRRDADERPELCRGTVEFVATKEFMVRDPMPAVYFFLIDVSMHAIQTGATAAACSSISQVIADLPEGPRTMVGIATFDSTIHFYNLKRALQQPLMLIVPDIHDVYTPLQTDVIVPLSECRQHLELLLESIPTMFQNSRIAESSFSAAIKAAFLAMKNTGGKLLVFQSVLPSVGVGALSAREAEGRSNISTGEKEAHKLLQPADKTLKEMAIEFAEYQVCVDVFITTQTYVDIASISVIPKTTGGQVYYYYPFSAVSDPAKLYNDLRWNVTRPQGFEAVMRVRCSQGIQIQEYHGNFCKRIPTDIDLAVIDCDKTIMVTLKHDDKLQDGTECAFQCALLYTTVYGQRRIRVANLSLPCTNNLSNLFRLADLDSQFVCFLKQAANEIPSNPSLVVQEQVTNFCINILLSYRKFCATVSSSGQLILPEALKLLPLYTLALIKSTGLKVNGRIDDRSFWISYVSSVSTPLAIPLVYPRMIAIHNLDSQEADGSRIPPALALSSEYVSEDGIYLLENGQDGLIYIGNSVNSDTLQKLFGLSSVAEIPTQYSGAI
uniref:Transport Sec24 family protein n=1 Tax=Populus trichocarpa TaxID=3694 RepID=A0A2K2ABR8_POPTR